MMKDLSISGKTVVCGLIGDPVEHTMSPLMHNAAFRSEGMDYVYLPFRVGRDELGEAIEGMRALNIRGLNVTIPHKVAVVPFLDELDPLVEKIGAVNTIVNDEGVLRGHNTDATGFLRPLLERGIEPKGKRVVVLGAGGASRAVSFILAERGAGLVILNRREEFGWAVELATRISRTFGREVEAMEMNEENLTAAIEGADILVNATSVGMGDAGETPVPSGLLRPGLTVYDVVYGAGKTRLVAEAEKAGAGAISGIEMLVWQGALAFELWTGLKAPVEVMKKAISEALQENEK
jgi:shikimate dehydrogenase